MRGKAAVLVLGALLVLTVPAGAAPSAAQSVEGRSDGVTEAEGVTWFVPERAQVGHPVHAGVAVLSGEGFATEMHTDILIWVTLDGELLYHTHSVHEHHGLHLLTVTPTEPGTLRFWADDGSGGDHDHLVDIEAATGDRSFAAPEPMGYSAEVPVDGSAIPALEQPRLGPGLSSQGPGMTWDLAAENDSVPYSALFTVADEEGRLVLSAWPSTVDGGSQVALATGPGEHHARALFTPHPAAAQTPFAEERVAMEAIDAVPSPDVGLPDPQDLLLPDCRESANRLILDPNSLLPAQDLPAWQEFSDIRIHYLDPQRVNADDPSTIRYTIIQWPVGGEVHPAAIDVTTDHPLGYVALRPPTPGNHLLVVEEASGEGFESLCSVHFQVLPEPAGAMESGKLETTLDVNNGSLEVGLKSLDSSGAALHHYEFDVQVVRLADEEPAWLAWRGKLHGHEGEVGFIMNHLLAGDYEMRVYPSPQDSGIAPLAAGADGFVFPFSVQEAAAEPEPEPVAETVPLPGVLLVVLLVLGAAGLRGARIRK